MLLHCYPTLLLVCCQTRNLDLHRHGYDDYPLHSKIPRTTSKIFRHIFHQVDTTYLTQIISEG